MCEIAKLLFHRIIYLYLIASMAIKLKFADENG